MENLIILDLREHVQVAARVEVANWLRRRSVCVCLILGRATHLYASSLKSTEQVKNRAMKQNIARFCGWLTYSYVCLPLRPFTHIMYRLWPSSKFIWTFIICMLNEAAYILVNNLYNSCKKHTNFSKFHMYCYGWYGTDCMTDLMTYFNI